MHQNSFHLLRFLAAIMVVYGHAYPLSGNGTLDFIQEASGGLVPTAQMGVFIFFSISGYLIAGSLENSRSYLNFFWKRFLRIWPGLTVCVLFIIFVIGALCTSKDLADYFSTRQTYAYLKVLKLYPYYPDTLPGVFDTLPITLINGSLWTLAYEVTLYCCLAVGKAIFRSRLRVVVAGLYLLGWSTFFIWQESFSARVFTLPFLHLSLGDLVNFSMYFLLGSLLFYYRAWVKYNGYWLLGGFVALMSAYVLSSRYGLIPLSAIVWVRFLFMPYLILFVAFRFKEGAKFERFGDISYGVYIYSFPIQQALQLALGRFNFQPEILFLIALLLILPLATFSWKYIEKPALQYKLRVK